MIRAQRPELDGQLRRARAIELIGVQLHAQAVSAGGGQDRARLGDAEDARLAEHVAGDGKPLARHGRDHLVAHQTHVLAPPIAELGGDFVRPQERGDESGGLRGRELRDDAQLLELALAVETVARLHLDRRAAVGEERAEPRAGERHELRFGAGADVAHRLQDAAARRRDLLVVHAEGAPLVVVQARRAEHCVRVAIHEARVHHTADFHPFHGARCPSQVGVATNRGNAVTVDQDSGVGEDLELRHLPPAARPRPAAAGDDLTRADQQRPQSLASRIGSRMACRRAASIASGYPASAWRAMPIPGSFVSTRSSRRPAAAVPSATLTCPAWSEFPMPTPPPWWNDTHPAPEAGFSRAFRMAQSATASEPSCIASVSRTGDATEPVSRWSRPMTTGAPISPRFTRSFKAHPKRARSPWPSQQMRAGRPWNATRCCASVIQRRNGSLSGNSSSTRRSVRCSSRGSPDNATQRKGPFPSQNSGRMYSGTKPGISNASATPASRAWPRMLLP